jgi:hypothetical protein
VRVQPGQWRRRCRLLQVWQLRQKVIRFTAVGIRVMPYDVSVIKDMIDSRRKQCTRIS